MLNFKHIIISTIITLPLQTMGMEVETSTGSKPYSEGRWVLETQQDNQDGCCYHLRALHQDFQTYTSKNKSFAAGHGYSGWYELHDINQKLKVGHISISFRKEEKKLLYSILDLRFINDDGTDYLKTWYVSEHEESYGRKSFSKLPYGCIFRENPRYKLSKFCGNYFSNAHQDIQSTSRPFFSSNQSIVNEVSDFMLILHADNIIDSEAGGLILECYDKKDREKCMKIAEIYYNKDRIFQDINKIIEKSNKKEEDEELGNLFFKEESEEEKIKAFLAFEFKNIDKYATPVYAQTLRWEIAEFMLKSDNCSPEIVMDLLKGIKDSNLPFFAKASLELANLQTLNNGTAKDITEKYKPKFTTLLGGASNGDTHVNAELMTLVKTFMNNDQMTTDALPAELQDFSKISDVMFKFMDIIRLQKLRIKELENSLSSLNK